MCAKTSIQHIGFHFTSQTNFKTLSSVWYIPQNYANMCNVGKVLGHLPYLFNVTISAIEMNSMHWTRYFPTRQERCFGSIIAGPIFKTLLNTQRTKTAHSIRKFDWMKNGQRFSMMLETHKVCSKQLSDRSIHIVYHTRIWAVHNQIFTSVRQTKYTDYHPIPYILIHTKYTKTYTLLGHLWWLRTSALLSVLSPFTLYWISGKSQCRPLIYSQ